MSIDLHLNQSKGTFSEGKTLFECAESLAIKVPTSCRKQGKCKECLMEVSEGMYLLSPRSDDEKHLKENFRLSCQCKLVASSGTLKCHTMRRGELVIEKHSLELVDVRKSLKLEPCVTRNGSSILIDGEEVDVNSGPIYGIAMDLGTTTVVLRLINLETGEIVADSSFENPQRFGGSDVLARIQYDTEEKGRVLQRTLLGYLSHAIEEFPVEANSIYELIVAGNSTMRDLFFGLNVYSIGQNPYQSITEIELENGERTTTTISKTAKQLRLPINPQARILGLPIISGHVGADTAACLLAIDLGNEDRTVALMDIGTNTELIVGNKHKILAASCPAGPAFEGGAISFGMPGLPGAIESVAFDEDNETFSVRTIGNGKPEGICGSGLISTLSELLRTDQMNFLGRFEEEDEDIVLFEDGDDQVTFNESDANELAQAKGANVAGLQIAFKEAKIAYEDLDVFFLAGGFGRHLDLEASKRIGLIPNIPDEKIIQVGNASIEGASIALLSKTKREELERMIKTVQHVRLEADPHFFDYFVDGCQFKPVETSTYS